MHGHCHVIIVYTLAYISHWTYLSSNDQHRSFFHPENFFNRILVHSEGSDDSSPQLPCTTCSEGYTLHHKILVGLHSKRYSCGGSDCTITLMIHCKQKSLVSCDLHALSHRRLTLSSRKNSSSFAALSTYVQQVVFPLLSEMAPG